MNDQPVRLRPLLARNGHRRRVGECRLSGAKQTSRANVAMSVTETPLQTKRLQADSIKAAQSANIPTLLV
jgi:hypothetical protein